MNASDQDFEIQLYVALVIQFFRMVLSLVVILIQKYENARGRLKLNSFGEWCHALHATAIGEQLKLSLKRLSFFNGITTRQMMLTLYAMAKSLNFRIEVPFLYWTYPQVYIFFPEKQLSV